ncbi:ABC transporter ATP-binding protein [Gordonia desulfuricans]|uniref:ABC transporter ATP-binding protein n=1 Tax=Gordonia desulfuricans TaxID=89051 RepID=A0A7K3LQ97_9ACTN|nr:MULTISPECIES: ABC transporter ATP-binding protein [Gordonia]EMP13891.2 ABC transporter ATP-binding protein [Gordonia sp. NB41Y]NDK90444.1 ABC transporter ATP-binding protein [Gordonia desulfuricans]WLP91720.1 ABC transporter ATP-binding protein [Gordonia sp. NB41Y]
MNIAPAIRAHNVLKTFRDTDGSRDTGGNRVTAVDHLDLTIAPGEVVAFLGPNGAGKTTTIDMMLGLSRPDSGEMTVFGMPPRQAARAGRIASVLQSGGLLPDYTVAETVRIIASLHGRTAEVDAVMDRADIAHLANRRVSRCSGGEQQRLKFALATLPDPDLIILDEPTAGMDVESRRAFWAAMRADARNGRTVVFATHYLDEADDFADRIVMLAHGRIVADGSTAQIRNVASRRVVSAIVDEDGLGTLGRTISDLEVVDRRGGRVYLSSADSDALARTLLTATCAREIEVATRNLEDAFVALTSAA